MLYFSTFDLFLCFSISVGRFLGNLGSKIPQFTLKHRKFRTLSCSGLAVLNLMYILQ